MKKFFATPLVFVAAQNFLLNTNFRHTHKVSTCSVSYNFAPNPILTTNFDLRGGVRQRRLNEMRLRDPIFGHDK